ncbi:MAG: signal peptidase I [Phycisphaeraceae bacterium]|nr:signal peptidase I [Phycisphaeraceae bacterium]
MPSTATTHAEHHHTKETVKETLISILIAFVLAFVFRGFVVEAFVIPTGSMAPTLDGAHMSMRAPQSGYTWDVGPWHVLPGHENEYQPVQTNVTVHDPMTGEQIELAQTPRLSGDRILVLKFLYLVNEPQRFDVVVFKCPYLPATNFIKRLVGLPGEQVALVDGDVFVRSGATPTIPGVNAWSQPGWTIARKPGRVQNTVWQAVFDSRYAPLNPMRDGRRWYNPPWVGSGWTVGGAVYEYTGQSPAELKWDSQQVRYTTSRAPWGNRTELWDIDDRYPYDEAPNPSWSERFPVSDVRIRAGIEPLAAGLSMRVVLGTRGHEFEASIEGTSASIRKRAQPGVGEQAWATLATATIEPLAPGAVTDVAFCHVDQALELWVGGKRVTAATYNWTPAERIQYATGRSIEQLLDEGRAGGRNIFADTSLYSRPRVSWSFRGGGVRMHRVGLDRDLYYQPAMYGPGTLGGQAALATSPNPESQLDLSPDEFFVLGDNSPQSRDGRLWDTVDPWAAIVDPKVGVVHRDLMIGKAFFVYFPAMIKRGIVPVPDFGRLRFIW